VGAARAVDAALSRGRAELAAACGGAPAPSAPPLPLPAKTAEEGGGGAAAAAAAAAPPPPRRPSAPPLPLPAPSPPPLPPPPPRLGASPPPTGASGQPLPRPRARRIVTPVTDRHFLPAAIALGPAAVLRRPAPGLQRARALLPQRDHAGYRRPDSPGRDLTLAEEGAGIGARGVRGALARAARAFAAAWRWRAAAAAAPAPAGKRGAEEEARRRQPLRDAAPVAASWGSGKGGGRVAPGEGGGGRGAFRGVR
jgi:hypothetical protein